MDFQAFVFFCFSAILIFAALRVITARNPVHAALFLFVVMMLDINLDRIRQGFWKHLPLGVLVGLLMVLEMGLVLGDKYFFMAKAADAVQPAGISNVKALGALMFSDYVYPFELASIILLVGMIAAIVLTYRGPKKSKNCNPSEQLAVKAKDRMRVLQMPVEKE